MRAIIVSFIGFLGAACATSPPASQSTPMEVRVLVDGEEWSPGSGAALSSAEAKPGGSLPAFDVQIVMAEMPRSVAEEVLGSSELKSAVYAPGKAPDVRALGKANAEIEALVDARLVVRSGGLASIIRSDKVSYVKDYTVENGIARAVTGWMEEGTWIDATPTLSTDGGAAEIDLSIQRRAIERPILDTKVSVPGTDFPVTVQLPEIDSQGSKSHVTLRLGGSYAFGFDPIETTPAAPRVVVAVMTVDRRSSSPASPR